MFEITVTNHLMFGIWDYKYILFWTQLISLGLMIRMDEYQQIIFRWAQL